MDALIKYITHLPKSGDVELTLLKTHLLIEELLTRIIEERCIRPNYLKKARFTFAHKITLARCLSVISDSSWVWGALKKLNDARNSLSHALDNELVEASITDFVEFIETQTQPIESKFLSEKFSRLHYASFYLYSELSAYANYDPANLPLISVSTILTGTPKRG